MFCITAKLPRENNQRFSLKHEVAITWDDIGGLEIAKQELRDALELPYQEPDLFKYYGIAPFRGALLYGPPGCGKTLC
jgi:proteasome-associated ATPase